MKDNEKNSVPLGTTIILLTRIGWGLVVLFGIVGILAGNQFGSIILLVVATTWVSIKVLNEALASMFIWKALRNPLPSTQEEDKSSDSDEET